MLANQVHAILFFSLPLCREHLSLTMLRRRSAKTDRNPRFFETLISELLLPEACTRNPVSSDVNISRHLEICGIRSIVGAKKKRIKEKRKERHARKGKRDRKARVSNCHARFGVRRLTEGERGENRSISLSVSLSCLLDRDAKRRERISCSLLA